MKLVIVESPTKAKTIKKYLPSEYVVESSLGHIRDLPKSATEIPAKYKGEKWSRLGINIEKDFEPLYIIPKDKKKHVSTLKKLIKEADELFLATDEDREGEAISWHLLEVLKPTVPVYRMVFHEITKEAILKALESPREIDMDLVQAQETRRILDRLYGYEISPVLWRKVAPKLSAGRVQSTALELIVQREQERMAFNTADYWDISGMFSHTDGDFTGKLSELDGKKIASGKDFDGKTGTLLDAKKDNVIVIDEAKANELATKWKNSTWDITSVEQRPLTLKPKPPFITSTLQQEGGHKLKWSARQTMQNAQRLYQKGFITYMRTDSVTLSNEAKEAAAAKIKELFGDDYLPESPRVYKNKSKNAQEAHEAIRPSGNKMRTPQEVAGELDANELKLYRLIWNRTVASQMANAKVLQTSVRLKNDGATMNASGRVVEFPGYLKAYVASAEHPEADANDKETVLPDMKEGETATGNEFSANEHATKPPARYTEASLVKVLEAEGVGRPSTYATIIDTIQRRGYIYKEGSALIPRFVAFGVTNLLMQNFSDMVNTQYTAAMEVDLDHIASGDKEYIPYLKQFYFGDDSNKGLQKLLEVDIDARATCTIPIGTDKDGLAINVRVGRYGPFVERYHSEDKSDTASIPADLPPDQLTVEMAERFIAKQAEGPKQLGEDPETKAPVYIIEGRFGPYVQLGDKPVTLSKEEKAALKAEGKKVPRAKKPKMKGLLKNMEVNDVTLETALQLLSYPKSVGVYEKTGEDIIADLGRYGPYLKCGEETRSLSAEDNLLELSLERATLMFDTPKVRGARAKVLRKVGEHPDDDQAITVYNGRYGPYLKYGKINVSIVEPYTPEKITLEESLKLIREKQDKM